MAEGEPFALIDKLKAEGRFEGAEQIVTIDGVRVEYGWLRPGPPRRTRRRWSCCASKPITQSPWTRIQAGFRQAISAVWPGIQLPF